MLQPDERAHHGIGQCLNGIRVLLDEADRRVQCRGRHVGAAEHRLGAFGGARVGDERHRVAHLEHGHDWVDVGYRVDLAGGHGSDGAGRRPDTDERNVFALEAVLGEQMQHHAIGARTRCADADLHALQILGRLVARGLGFGDADRNRRIAALQHETLHVEAFWLLVDGVFPRARDYVCAAADDCLQRLRAAVEIADLDIEPFLLEIIEALGDGQRQVIEAGFAADSDADLGLFDLALRVRRERQHRGKERARDACEFAKRCHGFLQLQYR